MTVALALTLALVVPQGLEVYDPPAAGSVRVVRDEYAVPHLVAAVELAEHTESRRVIRVDR